VVAEDFAGYRRIAAAEDQGSWAAKAISPATICGPS
jgi:hypothetical protein